MVPADHNRLRAGQFFVEGVYRRLDLDRLLDVDAVTRANLQKKAAHTRAAFGFSFLKKLFFNHRFLDHDRQSSYAFANSLWVGGREI